MPSHGASPRADVDFALVEDSAIVSLHFRSRDEPRYCFNSFCSRLFLDAEIHYYPDRTEEIAQAHVYGKEENRASASARLDVLNHNHSRCGVPCEDWVIVKRLFSEAKTAGTSCARGSTSLVWLVSC